MDSSSPANSFHLNLPRSWQMPITGFSASSHLSITATASPVLQSVDREISQTLSESFNENLFKRVTGINPGLLCRWTGDEGEPRVRLRALVRSLLACIKWSAARLGLSTTLAHLKL
ncbi:hypothetical protein C0Q70_13395 [Pomacea canaliculata]|uniref:Uncharacterized protein n=1 Tax=Pomacea canaliculata TaxID=400727 RepID=A0A2T7NX52_POMCA|nr:hypothetical protein C0Q70_13395 [Pomacea canaliculata]